MTSFVVWFVWSNVVCCNSPFLVESPICMVEGILDGGQVRIVIMSDAASVRKLSVVIVGIGIVCGMKTIVSVTISVFVVACHASVMIWGRSCIESYFAI